MITFKEWVGLRESHYYGHRYDKKTDKSPRSEPEKVPFEADTGMDDYFNALSFFGVTEDDARHPMTLRSIRFRLKRGEYQDADEAARYLEILERVAGVKPKPATPPASPPQSAPKPPPSPLPPSAPKRRQRQVADDLLPGERP